MYVPNFIRIGSGIQKLMGGYAQTRRQRGGLISPLLFFQKKQHRVKMLPFVASYPHVQPSFLEFLLTDHLHVS
jgi:hypothetical protein